MRPTSVDVVVATHHRPEMLREALAAIWAQDWPGRIRCLVVHDRCEPDRDLERHEGNRSIEVLSNSRSPGLAGARNTGILAGAGDLVAFCDDDDVWLPTKLTRQVEQITAEMVPTCVTGITVVYADREVPRIPTREELRLRHLARHRVMAAHPSSVLVRRVELLDEIGLVDEEIPGSYGEDFDWLLRAAKAGPVAVVPEPLVRVRWGSSQFSTQWRTIIDAIDYGLAKHQVFHDDPQALGRLYGRRAFALAALGEGGALPAVARTLRVAPRERRAYLAAAVALHLVSAPRLMDLAHRRGHGI